MRLGMKSVLLALLLTVMGVLFPAKAQNQDNSDRATTIKNQLKQFAAVAGKLTFAVPLLQFTGCQ